jgi:hypothetical protein
VTRSADRAYPGSRPYERANSGQFFGRAAEAAELGQVWRDNPVTFLSGPTGIGKTSLLTAGVLPLVEDGNVSLLPVGSLSRGARSPVAALREHNPFTLALLRSWSGAETATDLAGVTVHDFVRQHAGRQYPSVLILAAIDQADDLFAGTEASQRNGRRFLDELAAALREQPTLHLLVSIREDSLSRVAEVIGPGVQFQLGALEVDQACRVAAGDGQFEPRAAGELVRRIRTSRIVSLTGGDRIAISDDVEPALLQIACARLRDQLRNGSGSGAITMREMRRHGDVDGALVGYCSETIAAVAAIHEIPVARLRFWLIETFITKVGGRSSAEEQPTGTAGQPKTVARALEDRHLLRAQAGAPPGARRYELLSDRLIEPIRQAEDVNSPPEDPADYLAAAERALVTGELSLAERYAAKVLSDAPDTALRWHAEAHSLLGNVCYERGHFDQAEERYQAAASLFEVIGDRAAVVRSLAAIGRTLSDRGRLADALTQLTAALSRASADATVQLELSWVMAELTQRSSDGPHGRRDVSSL